MAAAYYPQSLTDPNFVVGLRLQAGVLALCFLLTWDRLPCGAFWLIPLLDFLAVGFIRHGSAQYVTSAGLLVLFPIFWLSASGPARKTAVASSTPATLLIVWVDTVTVGLVVDQDGNDQFMNSTQAHLRAQALPADLATYLTIAQRNAQRPNRLVSDLLATDSMEVTPALTDISAILAQCLASARPMASRNGVELLMTAPVQLRAMVDAGRIGQALGNLISNAIRYSPDGGTVTVRAWHDGAEVVCEVQDTGMGMSSAEQAQAFTKFFRADPALERSAGVGAADHPNNCGQPRRQHLAAERARVGTTRGWFCPTAPSSRSEPGSSITAPEGPPRA
ncbi:sensor histidine kinase [Arthrobacter sp. TMN-49]